MSDLLLERPDLRVFWSAYDPLDLASDSIDPLGFMAGYVALADRILPGFTTITTIPRYASMLCLALRFAGGYVDVGENISVRRRLIIEKLKLFERAWGLACGLTEEDPAIGAKATDGLRGIRAVHRWRDLNAGKEKLTLSFELLSNQVRYGGIGAYSTFLESLHLADMSAMALRPLGEQLADAFPSPAGYDLDVMRSDAKLSADGLREWGREAHAGTLTTPESQVLRRALQGGEEAEFDDVTRWTMLRLLRSCDPQQQLDEPGLLAACQSSLKQNGRRDLDPVIRIRTALRTIEPYERLYQCALFVFDHVRLQAASSGQVNLQVVLNEQAVGDAIGQMRNAAVGFLAEIEGASNEESSLGIARQALHNVGVVQLAQTIIPMEKPTDVGQEILRRHMRVQEGKFDGGLPKGPWVRLEPEGVARLTAQRFGLDTSQVKDNWRVTTRHPYRTFGARRFIRLCRIQ